MLIYQEVGGTMSSIRGKQFTFRSSRGFGDAWGYAAADERLKDALLGVVDEVLMENAWLYPYEAQ